MKILHISPHYGGGIGTVISALIQHDKANDHTALALDKMKEKKVFAIDDMLGFDADINGFLGDADIVMVHIWDNHPMIQKLFSRVIPPCRMVFWNHNRVEIPSVLKQLPDKFINTSPVQGEGEYIWSTGRIERFPVVGKCKFAEGNFMKHFCIGYVGAIASKKIHPLWRKMCDQIINIIPYVLFTSVGMQGEDSTHFRFIEYAVDVLPYLLEFDVFGYPLHSDHVGTCEQVLGEAMACGVVPVVMANPAEMVIVKHGHNGFVATTEQDYIHHIAYLYEHPERRLEMATAARRTAVELYSIDTMVSEWNKVWAAMMKEDKRERGLL